MSREKEFAKNSVILSLGTIFPKLTSIITLPIITGCLTKADYGTYDLITILVSLFLPVATMQMQAAAFRFLIDKRKERKEQEKIITNIVFFTVPVCVAALTILYFALGRISGETRLLILIYFFIDTLLITARQIARGLSKNTIYSISALMNAVLEMACMFTALKILGGELNSAILSLIIPQTVSLIYIIFSARLFRYIKRGMFSFKEIRSLIAYSWPMIPNSLSSWVMRASDRLILTWFMGVEANAVYAVANKLPNMFSIVQGTFTLAWQENASVSVNDKDSDKYYGTMFSRVLDFFAGVMGLLIATTPITFRILIRGEYSDAYDHMPILFIAAFFAAISSYLGGIYIAHMKSKQIGITTTIAAAINFVINIAFVTQIGIFAASISTLVSYLWLTVYRMINVQKIQKIKFDYARTIILTLALCGMSALCFLRITAVDAVNIAVSAVFAFMLNKSMIFSILRVIRKKIKKGGKAK